MKAVIGDELIVKGRHHGGDDRRGEVMDVLGDDGSPPYLVCWLDGYESLFFPSASTVVQHREKHPASA
jgi:hypothetical protein